MLLSVQLHETTLQCITKHSFFSYFKSKRGERQTYLLFPAMLSKLRITSRQAIRWYLTNHVARHLNLLTEKKGPALQFTQKTHSICPISYSTTMTGKSHQELIEQDFLTRNRFCKTGIKFPPAQLSSRHNRKSSQSQISFPSLWGLKSFSYFQVWEAA